MNLEGVRNQAREMLAGVCQVCRICDGQACAGKVPGMGSRGTGAGFFNNTAALAHFQLNMSALHEAKNPDLSYDLFGHTLSFPIIAAPMCDTTNNLGGAVEEDKFIRDQFLGAKKAGSIAMAGDAPNPLLFEMGLRIIRELKGSGIAVIKPREQEEIFKRIRQAEEAGALAVSIDIDAAAFSNFYQANQVLEPKTAAQVKEICRSTSLPVIIKGIMSGEDAFKVAEAGAQGIVVSNHGGRALDHTPGTARVLPEIANLVKKNMKIFMDGGIRKGEDVLKALALGAEAVLVGRPLAIAAVGGGARGVELQLEQLAKELREAMILTGCSKLKTIGPHILYGRPG